MKVPNVNIKKPLADGYNAAKEGIKEGFKKAKPGIENGLKYTKNLAIDTIDIVKKNPKKTGLIAAGALLLTALTTGFIKSVKANLVKNEHIAHQREMIETLKDSCDVSQEIISAQNDTIDAARIIIKKQQESLEN